MLGDFCFFLDNPSFRSPSVLGPWITTGGSENRVTRFFLFIMLSTSTVRFPAKKRATLASKYAKPKSSLEGNVRFVMNLAKDIVRNMAVRIGFLPAGAHSKNEVVAKQSLRSRASPAPEEDRALNLVKELPLWLVKKFR